MTPHDLAVRMLVKAAQDEAAADHLIHAPAVGEETVGFHLQQAAEKLLKAVLAENDIPYDLSHNLLYLLQLLEAGGTRPPAEMRELGMLNPFAVAFRYDLLPDVSAFDRAKAQALVADLRTWCEARVPRP